MMVARYTRRYPRHAKTPSQYKLLTQFSLKPTRLATEARGTGPQDEKEEALEAAGAAGAAEAAEAAETAEAAQERFASNSDMFVGAMLFANLLYEG
jgi:hypothetical protein